MKKYFIYLALLFSVLNGKNTAIKADTGVEEVQTKELIFGSQLFNGNFSTQKNSFNETYKINYKDELMLNIWGEIELSQKIKVDLKGNIFIPNIGIVKAQGITSKKLEERINIKLKTLFKSNIQSYINILGYEAINIIVAGKVKQPGSYSGYPNDLLLSFLDKSGGLLENSNYRQIIIKRSNQAVKKIDLYSFITSGDIDAFQFRNGDVIYVPESNNYVKIKIDKNIYKFFLKNNEESLKTILKNYTQNKKFNSFILTREGDKDIEYSLLDKKTDISVKQFDTIELIKTNINKNIRIKIENKENDRTYYITLDKQNAFKQIMAEMGLLKEDLDRIKIYRKSVAAQQKESINKELDYIEKRLAYANSGNIEEENIRVSEQKRMQIFIDEARKVETKGQIIVSNPDDLMYLKLKQDDIIEVTDENHIVSIQGEVYFPNTYTINSNTTIKDVIKWSGGLTDKADEDKIFILSKNGFIQSAIELDKKISNSDTLFVMSKVDSKTFLFVKDITQVVYQIMLSAGILIRP
jgi:protein involved in polysaccharide export with SLBB domain